MKKKKKVYAYFIDIGNTGIVYSWEECEAKIKGVKGARCKSFDNEADANKWLEKGARYDYKKKMEKGIYFDAGTGAGKGVEINVTDENSIGLLWKVLPVEKLNKKGHFLIKEDVTNNYGELLAFKYALKIALDLKVKKVFGDSNLIIEYWSKGHYNRKNLPPKTIKLIKEVTNLRKEFEKKGGRIEKVKGKDNPADLGYHVE